METKYVYPIYDKIATQFNITRQYNYWNSVKTFLDILPKYSVIADIGCGNAKYMKYVKQFRKDIVIIGNDTCNNLLILAQENNLIQANALNLPYKNNTFDAIISIAVLHHVFYITDHIQFIDEIIRCLIYKAKALIVVYAYEQQINPKWKHIGPRKNDYLIPWSDKGDRYYYLFSYDEIKALFDNTNVIIEKIYFEMDNWCVIIQKC